MKTILIVEDDDDLRELMAICFVGAGYRVVEARDGREALEATTQGNHQPDAVILDLMMPVLSGAAVLKALRARSETASLPIVIVSAVADVQRPPGADAYLRKPVTCDRVLAVVQKFAPA